MGANYNAYLAKIARLRSQEKAGQRRLDDSVDPAYFDETEYEIDWNEPLPEESE